MQAIVLRGAHDGAGAGRDRQPSLDGLDLIGVDRAGAVLRPEAPAVGARPKPLTLVAARRHRPSDELDGGEAGGGRAHQLRRHGLIAAADQHDRVHRLGTDHLLGVHRHEIAVHHAGRVEEHLAERDGRKRPRKRAGRKHPARDRLDELGHVAVAVVEARRRHGDAYHRLVQELAGDPHRARERAAQETREVAIAVVGQAPLEPMRLAAHATLRASLTAGLLRYSAPSNSSRTRTMPPLSFSPCPRSSAAWYVAVAAASTGIGMQ